MPIKAVRNNSFEKCRVPRFVDMIGVSSLLSASIGAGILSGIADNLVAVYRGQSDALTIFEV